MNHRWTNRIFPPLVIVAVVGGVWYAATHRAEETAVAETTHTTTPVVTSAKPVQQTAVAADTLAMPLVEKLPGKVRFTVTPKKTAKVQKVEFYVSNRLVGAAYSEPFTVSIDEKSLQPGTHQVVAKVYTDADTQNTPPADFVSTVTPGTKPSTDAIATTPPATTGSTASGNSGQTQQGSSDPNPGSGTTAQPASPPTNVVATASDSTPEISVSWSAPADGSATAYRIVRGGTTLEDNYSGTTYLDDSVAADTPYTYQIISIGSDGSTASASSNPVTYTAPGP